MRIGDVVEDGNQRPQQDKQRRGGQGQRLAAIGSLARAAPVTHLRTAERDVLAPDGAQLPAGLVVDRHVLQPDRTAGPHEPLGEVEVLVGVERFVEPAHGHDLVTPKRAEIHRVGRARTPRPPVVGAAQCPGVAQGPHDSPGDDRRAGSGGGLLPPADDAHACVGGQAGHASADVIDREHRTGVNPAHDLAARHRNGPVQPCAARTCRIVNPCRADRHYVGLVGRRGDKHLDGPGVLLGSDTGHGAVHALAGSSRATSTTVTRGSDTGAGQLCQRPDKPLVRGGGGRPPITCQLEASARLR